MIDHNDPRLTAYVLGELDDKRASNDRESDSNVLPSYLKSWKRFGRRLAG